MATGGGLVKIAGVDKELLREFFEMEVDPKVWEEFSSRRNGALLGVDIARDRELKSRYVWREGADFVITDLGDLSLYFVGTFVPKDPTLRSVILTGDVFLQEADERRGVANQILVKIAHRDEGTGIAEGIEALDFPVKLTAESAQFARDQAGADLTALLSYASDVIVVLGIVILLGLANAMSMAVRERVREIGLLRSIGFTRTRIVTLVAAESLLLALGGGIVGCAAAWIAIRGLAETVSVGNYAFPLTMGLPLAVAAAAGAVAVGLVGGLPAGIRACQRPIVEALRSVD